MKRNLIIIILLVLVAPALSYAVPVSDTGNPHNLSSLSDSDLGFVKAKSPTAGGTDQICIFCHTPHSAAPKSTLWSRRVPTGPNGDGTFPVYATVLEINKNEAAKTLTGYDETSSNYPSGASRMCLSCHDGVTSIGILLGDNITMESGSETVTNNTIQGIVDLSKSHPISFNYTSAVVALIDPADVNYQLPAASFTPLDGNEQMQCTTCHDPHEDTRALSGGLPFWRHQGAVTAAERYQEVCDSCHKGAALPAPPVHDLP